MGLPANPFSGQEFVDADRVVWRFNGIYELWERTGVAETIPLADGTTVGMLPASFKATVDGILDAGGGFGLILHPLQQYNDSSCNLISGDIKLVSDSLDINCFNEDAAPDCYHETYQDDCCDSPEATPPSLQFRMKSLWLKSTKVIIRSVKGPDGDCGDRGPPGYSGFCGGPSGVPGGNGQEAARRYKLTGVTYRDLEGITDTAIVQIRIRPNKKSGCALTMTTSRLLFDSTAAAKLQAEQIERSIVYATSNDPCKPVRLQDYTIQKPGSDSTPLNLFMMRTPDNSARDYPSGVYLNSTVTLDDFIAALVNKYEEQLFAVDARFRSQTKAYIESVDDEARSILSSLAGTVAQTQFTLPAVEYGITLTKHGNTAPLSVPTPTSTPPLTTLQVPTPAPPATPLPQLKILDSITPHLLPKSAPTALKSGLVDLSKDTNNG